MNFNPKCIRSLINDRRNIHSFEVLPLLGLRRGAHLPPEGMPARNIQGYKVWVDPTPVRVINEGYYGLRRKSSTHRVKVQCHCGWVGSLGRMHQHKCLTWPGDAEPYSAPWFGSEPHPSA